MPWRTGGGRGRLGMGCQPVDQLDLLSLVFVGAVVCGGPGFVALVVLWAVFGVRRPEN
jgi:hypothetical protein